MEKVKISFLDLVNVLSQQEMKKVTGGSAMCVVWCCYGDYFNCETRTVSCAGNSTECEGYQSPWGCEILWCY